MKIFVQESLYLQQKLDKSERKFCPISYKSFSEEVLPAGVVSGYSSDKL